MLESAQLAPMYDAPTWQVEQLRKSGDAKALRTLLEKYASILKPYKKQ